MNRTRAWRLLATGFILSCGFLAVNAAGYIDPGTGSYVLQIAIAFLVGLAFSIRVFWKKIVAFLRKTFATKKGGGADAT
jgi:hypothetical protein